MENTAEAFRTEWSLAAGQKILGANTTNLDRGDEINMCDGSVLADRLSYGAEPRRFPGSVRTQGKSGVPTSCLALGVNSDGAWVLSAVGDGRGSRSSARGDIGSPGTTPLAPARTDLARRQRRHRRRPELRMDDDHRTRGLRHARAGLRAERPDVLWAVKNKNRVFRLVRDGDLWVSDPANGWAAGKQILSPGAASRHVRQHLLGLDDGPRDQRRRRPGTLAVRRSGFFPGESVVIDLQGKNCDRLASVVADRFGLVVVDVTIPTGVRPGAHELRLTSPSTTAWAPMTVTAPAAHPER